jgi:hypothetical protein
MNKIRKSLHDVGKENFEKKMYGPIIWGWLLEKKLNQEIYN